MKHPELAWARLGMGTLAVHVGEGQDPLHAHVAPIYQTSTFSFPDVATGAALFAGEREGYVYTRVGNPNAKHLARKIAALEAYDLLRQHPDKTLDDLVAGWVLSTGMGAISTAILSRVGAGGTLIAPEVVYGGTFEFLHNIAPRLGIHVVWVKSDDLDSWAQAFEKHPDARLAYVETPANPSMTITDIAAVVEMAHAHNAWVCADNTFATPYCQRPLTLGADLVLHSTTKYITGHGVVVGGAVISPHLEFMRTQFKATLKSLGTSPSPFDTWLTNIGLKTFELRMQRHCENGMAVARFLEKHPKIARVMYPGLESFPGHAVAKKQMHCFGGMISFEMAGGFEAGVALMENIRLATLAVSLGNVDTLIEHPASMTHAGVPQEEREAVGITNGLVRLSVGIENTEDILADLQDALEKV